MPLLTTVFLPLLSFSAFKLALVLVLPEAVAPAHLMWICLLELCAKEAFIGYKQGCWDLPVNRELLQYDAIWLACSEAPIAS